MKEWNLKISIPETKEERDAIVRAIPKTDWDAFFMYRAFSLASQSPDAQTKQGVVLVDTKSHRTIAEGFNGFSAGIDDSKLPRYRPDKYSYMIHCEPNAWNWSAKIGAHFEDVTVYCTMTSCEVCARNHVTANSNLTVKRMVYWEYRKHPAAEKIFELHPDIIIEKFEGGVERLQDAMTQPLQYLACTPQTGRLDSGWTENYSGGIT